MPGSTSNPIAFPTFYFSFRAPFLHCEQLSKPRPLFSSQTCNELAQPVASAIVAGFRVLSTTRPGNVLFSVTAQLPRQP
jgi:hypothetical protein